MPQEVVPQLANLQPSPTDHAVQASEPISQMPITQLHVRMSQAIIVILQLTAITFLTSLSSGLMTVSIPRIASDLGILPQLYYW